MPSISSESGNQSPNEPCEVLRAADVAGEDAVQVSSMARCGVNGWSAAIRLSQSAAEA